MTQRRVPTDLGYEPPYPDHPETVMFTLDDPTGLTAHSKTTLCPLEYPHAMQTCPEWIAIQSCPEWMSEVEHALTVMVRDNVLRGRAGADVNWALIHWSQGILNKVRKEETQT